MGDKIGSGLQGEKFIWFVFLIGICLGNTLFARLLFRLYWNCQNQLVFLILSSVALVECHAIF